MSGRRPLHPRFSLSLSLSLPPSLPLSLSL
ncbi:unnamed protein product [Spirodela intermedia]|uniref:Uncharacterized protein n=1 Tax=Spirodela intermedia TaxID=51605 RepID=A0A7I8LAT3_SPIIN|nr:unnamed protein product [Spirodela intermedia]